VRRLLLPLSAIAVVVALVVGLSQAGSQRGSGPPKPRKPSAAEVRRAFAGSPPPLRAVHQQANDILSGGRPALDARIRDLRGHPVVVNVWAAWCGPCRVELPVFQQAALSRGSRVAFLGVDLKDNRGSARRLLGQVPLTYPSYDDPDGRIAQRYRLIGTPSTIFYDARGRQSYVHQGPYERVADLERDIDRYARA
jgi:cytochrome c biogenesis protein CcmG, thiol:disulfide interchange protein DsbE